MAYKGKTNWQNNEIVEASDMNRIEQGILDADVGLGNVQAEVTAHKADDMTKSGGNFTGITTAYSNTSYTVRQIRNIILSPEDAVLESMQDGDIWIKYK